jgi:hypothetical protein
VVDDGDELAATSGTPRCPLAFIGVSLHDAAHRSVACRSAATGAGLSGAAVVAVDAAGGGGGRQTRRRGLMIICCLLVRLLRGRHRRPHAQGADCFSLLLQSGRAPTRVLSRGGV